MKISILNIIKPLLLMTIIFTTIACEEDFVNVESDITGAQNFTTKNKLFPFVAYNKKVNPVQTSNLSGNVLGIYNDPNYGSTAASFITQITPDNLAPVFGENPTVTSVNLYIPYFSTLTDTDAEGDSTYTLDSIYGDDLSQPFKLSVYKSSYFLRNLDPQTNFDEDQAYYSNAYAGLNLNAFEEQLLYPADPSTTFTPDASEIVFLDTPEPGEEPEVLDRLAPGIYLDLNDSAIVPTNFWNDILFTPEGGVNPEITNTATFKNFFRGLILKVEQNNTSVDGSLFFLNLSTEAKVEIKYEYDGEDDTRETGTYSFNFNGNRFNTFENLSNFSPLADGDQINGDDQLFLKGFEGSMTVLDLFNGDIIDENNTTQNALAYFEAKKGKWLINEANLNLYVDHSVSAGGTSEPDRIMVYDLNNNLPIIDYFIDVTSNSTDPANSKTIYSPKLERDENGKGVKYKIRLTEHLNNILLRDSTNTKLGVYVTNNINLFGTSKILNATESEDVNTIPQSTIIAPKGTILHGNTPAVPENVRATFEIFYTEPEN